MGLINWFRNKVAALSLALSNVESDVLGQSNKYINSTNREERRYRQGTLADSLVQGEVTQEVKDLRWRMYKVLKASENLYLTKNKDLIKNFKSDNLRKVKLDEFDNYPLEMVYHNNSLTNSIFDSIKNLDETVVDGNIHISNNDKETPLNVKRNFISKFLIESYTKKLNIRAINETDKLIEFYVSKYPDEHNFNTKLLIKELKKAIDNKSKIVDFLEISEIEFITYKTTGVNDFLYFNYEIIGLDKIVEFDGNYVIKYNAKVKTNGMDMLTEYVEPELEKKYENKEARNLKR